MALNQKQRDERRHEKAAKFQEEDLRLKVRPGTKQALLELMQWSGIEEQGEAMTLMIHHLHGLGQKGSAPFLSAPRHVFVIKQNVARLFDQKSMLMIQKDPGDEILAPETDAF